VEPAQGVDAAGVDVVDARADSSTLRLRVVALDGQHRVLEGGGVDEVQRAVEAQDGEPGWAAGRPKRAASRQVPSGWRPSTATRGFMLR
jgi:hypothetical protein